MNENRLSYARYLHSDGTLPGLTSYTPQLVNIHYEFYHRYDTSHSEADSIEMIQFGIMGGWSGAFMAFDKGLVAGFLTFRVREDARSADVGFAGVLPRYRNQGIWSTMSEMVEVELRDMGVRTLHRQVYSENTFLAEHLTRRGYRLVDASLDDWPNYMLTL